ncbi:MFS transporter [Actinoplanes sp. L3-i22]|uniref:MFS transporter n=1 Tax=Actinoplanes sp. L3-i22 TaxID=2836373 RepID=UPI001C8483F1|nr:MFS transporter [Actinoplanes sp. L3-i22]
MSSGRSGGADTAVPPNRPADLARYVAAATMARSADGGAVVAVVLMVTVSGAPGWLAGLLGACVTAPHLLGPFVARRLDTARDGRTVIAAACVAHGATLAAAVLVFPHVPAVVTGLLLIASGLVGPLLTGGISSRLPAIAGPDRTAQRRAQGWDVATYGLGGTVGPAIVAAVSAWASPTAAALLLAAATALAAILVRMLPWAPPPGAPSEVPRPARTLLLMLASGPLRRTLYMTVTVAFALAALPITAVASVGVAAALAGVLTAAYGLGNLAGSAVVMIRPLRGDADHLMTRLGLVVAVALGGVALAPGFSPAVVAYFVTGVLNAHFFAATLAARSEFAPARARGQVFVWIGAVKITAGSAGTALAGALIGVGGRLPLVLSVTVVTLVSLVSALDRRTRGTAHRSGPAAT